LVKLQKKCKHEREMVNNDAAKYIKAVEMCGALGPREYIGRQKKFRFLPNKRYKKKGTSGPPTIFSYESISRLATMRTVDHTKLGEIWGVHRNVVPSDCLPIFG
jgi:hypothetical protein